MSSTRAAFFVASGIPRIEQVMTDNAWAYRHSLTTMVAKLGATQIFIKPHCPRQNRNLERFTRTLQTESAYRYPFTSNTEHQAALAPWLNTYR
ncbi:MAG: hypothetical protein B5766_05835 [Candidatus Lumbricidophila eiseniae]|uniref:Integrase catalytic domain-containing protein n=1 Tax=Candidatus Lumbricidiphila eiseniae TaxID=1969409 RepID=A0A2A6FRR8_9MICO|nr:MAG: hypothetical protein B5766_05835 [Candidatus Lumbricidophila eiseniae]